MHILYLLIARYLLIDELESEPKKRGNSSIILKKRIRRVNLETVHLTSVFSIWKCEDIALIDNFGLNFFWLFSGIRMKFSTLYSPNIMFILTANQNARVIMKIYYAHCDWLRDNDTTRAFELLTIGKNGTIGRPFYQWYQCYQHREANNADKIQHGQIYQREKCHMIQYGEHENVL